MAPKDKSSIRKPNFPMRNHHESIQQKEHFRKDLARTCSKTCLHVRKNHHESIQQKEHVLQFRKDLASHHAWSRCNRHSGLPRRHPGKTGCRSSTAHHCSQHNGRHVQWSADPGHLGYKDDVATLPVTHYVSIKNQSIK